jgi:TRAP-type C4-dicarboxylate transport system permease small subunit
MCFVFAEVIMRYLFNSPIPGHLEGSELLLPIIVFAAISYTQARDGHVGMTLVIDALSPDVRRIVDIVILALSMCTCAVLAYFSAKMAWQAYQYDDVTMTPPYWRVWPSAAAVPLGYALISVRMYLQILQLVAPQRVPAPLHDDEGELHAID